ncbi:hypothetical protein PT974_00704 [Cladobotryum mycophilum]|uniref:Extracellular membrane protein CFEM domain-containing protein n=1 Tax=Cladobotryum mycophilum TaxID=491253 RepID=A0ABR0T2T0_9HYPO
MHFLKLVAIVTAAAVPLTEACKCINQKTKQAFVEGTSRCCRTTGGSFQGDDCNAHSIKDDLDTFDGCCEDLKDNYFDPFKSDCKYK